MKKNIVKFEFNGLEVDFEQGNHNLMINATQMAKMFDKRVENFTRIEESKLFIAECLNNANQRYLNIKSEDDLIISSQKSGTWMHRILALKFAAWLSPAFELWVYSTIDDLLFGRLRKTEESLRQSAARKNRIEELRAELLKDERYFEIERLELEERQAAYSRGKNNRNQLDLFRNQEEFGG